jgi:hypothetical protein
MMPRDIRKRYRLPFWRRRRLSRCTLRFHEIDDLEIARACGRDSWSHDKETSKRFWRFS